MASVNVTDLNFSVKDDNSSQDSCDSSTEIHCGQNGIDAITESKISNESSPGKDRLLENEESGNSPDRNSHKKEEISQAERENVKNTEDRDSVDDLPNLITDRNSNLDEISNPRPKPFVMDDSDNHLTAEDGWLDIFGSGDFKKRVIKPGNGERVQAKNVITINYTAYKGGSDEVVEKEEGYEFIVGDLDVVKGVDLAIPIMEHGETAEILVPSRLAYGKTGRPPDIPADCDLRYVVEILKAEEFDEESLPPTQSLKYGNQKRDRGNFWYGQGDYISAIHCYKRAAEFLDAIQDGSDCSPALLQEILDTKIKVHNNMAAAHLKMESYDQALKSVDFVLKIQSKNVKALFRKAKILTAKGLTDEALVPLKKAAELEPETKVIQQELLRLQRKRQVEHKTQQEMYKRMFPPSSAQSKPSRFKRLVKRYSIMTGSCVALAIAVAAYRQFYS